jgi:hypothetical protein
VEEVLSQLLNVHNISDVRQGNIHSAEPLVPGPSRPEVEIAIVKLKNIKTINYVWNKKELPDQWNKIIILPIHKIGDRTDCSNYRGISLLSTSYNILSNLLLSRLSLYIDEIIGDHQCEFQLNINY